MPTSLISITHALRVHLADAGIPIVLGHSFQLVAAAFGYTNLAALQATNEPDDLTPLMHWIVDVKLLLERGVSLGLVVDVNAFVKALTMVSRDQDGPQIHSTDADLEIEFLEIARSEALDDNDVAIQMADTNTTGPWNINLELSDITPLPLRTGDVFLISYEGQVEGEHEQDRPYSGHAVNVSAQVALTAIGRRLVLGPPKVEVTGAELDAGYYGMDDDGSSRPLDRLEAFAMELDVPFAERWQLEGAEATGDTTSAGAPNGYLVNITNCESSPIVDRIRAEYPLQEIWVQGHALERTDSFGHD